MEACVNVGGTLCKQQVVDSRGKQLVKLAVGAVGHVEQLCDNLFA
jgi:hypothetical protein